MMTGSQVAVIPSQTSGRAVTVLADRYAGEDRERIFQVWGYAVPRYGERTLKEGESAAQRAVQAAETLSSLRADPESVCAALLMFLPRFDPAWREPVAARFGEVLAALVEGVRRMDRMGALAAPAGKGAQAEPLRQMLLAMAQDLRVVLVKLADQTQTLRHEVKRGPSPARTAAAREAMDLFAPLANRLGVWQLKWDLEDLAFRILEPEFYKRIAGLLDEKRADREAYIARVIASLEEQLRSAGIAGEVSGRPKHIYSIYRKMQRKELEFSDLYDVLAVRVLVESVRDCYAVLGLAHQLWAPIPKEFDDYIAKPKANDYRSLHTAVIGPENKAVEIQIRTFEMHRHAELGVAAHWRYKEGGRQDAGYEEKIAWLRQLLAWKDEVATMAAAGPPEGPLDDAVYVLTPQGQVVALGKGATPVDFAYHVHTSLGHRCRGAKVDGTIVPLNTPLAVGQRVEIIAAKEGGPSRDWLNPALGYIHSPRARAKVRQWFNTQNLQADMARGRAMVERELRRLGLTGFALDKLADRLGFAKIEELLVAVARGEVGSRPLRAALQGDEAAGPAGDDGVLPLTRPASAPATPSGILVVGVDRLLTVLAKCCKPAPPDPIVGFVSRGRGVTIHRRTCLNVPRLPEERLMEADWGQADGSRFVVDVRVEASDRQGLLRDISEILSRERINVIAANTLTRGSTAGMGFTLEILDVPQLERVLGMIREVAGVERAARK